MAEITPAAPSEQDQIEIYQLYVGLREVSPAVLSETGSQNRIWQG